MKNLMEENNSAAPVTSQGDEEGNWMEAFVDTEVDHDALEKDYVTTMQNERFSSAKLQESHSFHGNLQALEPRWDVFCVLYGNPDPPFPCVLCCSVMKTK